VTEPRTPYLTGLRYWLTNVTGAAEDPLSVSDRLFRRLLAAGVPLLRANIAMTTLHPEIIGFSYRWTRESDELRAVGCMTVVPTS
jgi:hypothetical protein